MHSPLFDSKCREGNSTASFILIRSIDRFVWFLSDQILVSTLPNFLDAVEQKVEFRLILPENISPPDSVRERVDEPIFEQASTTGLLKTRFLEKVDLFI